MKVMFDTNIYISFIRNRTHRTHSAELQRRGTTKYLSAVVLMELWAGSRDRRGERLLHQLQKPYMDAPFQSARPFTPKTSPILISSRNA